MPNERNTAISLLYSIILAVIEETKLKKQSTITTAVKTVKIISMSI